MCSPQSALPDALVAVNTTIAAIDRSCSAFRQDSDLSAVNRSNGRWVDVGDDFIDVLAAALALCEATDGLADPTVGRVTLAASEPVSITLLPPADWRGVEVDCRGRRVRVRRGLCLDLGAIAKARCVDLAADAAHAVTGEPVLVSLLGDIAVAGPSPEGGWPIVCVDDHRGRVPEAPGISAQIIIRAGGLATSSLCVRRTQRGSHVVDPRTFRPVEGPVRTVSVAAANCAHANAAATAALVRGASAGAWLESLSLPARLVYADGHIETTGGWPQ